MERLQHLAELQLCQANQVIFGARLAPKRIVARFDVREQSNRREEDEDDHGDSYIDDKYKWFCW